MDRLNGPGANGNKVNEMKLCSVNCHEVRSKFFKKIPIRHLNK